MKGMPIALGREYVSIFTCKWVMIIKIMRKAAITNWNQWLSSVSNLNSSTISPFYGHFYLSNLLLKASQIVFEPIREELSKTNLWIWYIISSNLSFLLWPNIWNRQPEPNPHHILSKFPSVYLHLVPLMPIFRPTSCPTFRELPDEVAHIFLMA